MKEGQKIKQNEIRSNRKTPIEILKNKRRSKGRTGEGHMKYC